jgi:NADPH:quinone reductase-like Zn-dependent oxidoreductase
MATPTMRAWHLMPGARSPDDLALVEVTRPEPRPGEILVRVRACSLNYRDRLIAEGLYPVERGFVPLSDGAGEVVALGEGVTRFRIGDRVAASFLPDWFAGPPRKRAGKALGQPGAPGMLAEYVVLAEKGAVALAESLDFSQAATLPCAGVTAWNALMEGPAPLAAGEWVLVLGTGGVALMALQIAQATGARVIVTSSSDEKLARACALGAEAGINYHTVADWGLEAARISDGGVRRVVETGGSGTLTQSISALAYGGEVALIGVMAKGEPPLLGGLLARSASVRGVSVGSREMAERLNRAIDARGIVPIIDQRFALMDAREAYRYQASPDLFGKIVVTLE